jgi:hypothetical protein
VRPRQIHAAATVVLLLAFVADVRPVVPLVAIALVAQLVAGRRLFPHDEVMARLNAVVEAVLLGLATLFFVVGHSGWGWALAFVVALLAGAAAVAELWLSGIRDLARQRQVRRPQ